MNFKYLFCILFFLLSVLSCSPKNQLKHQPKHRPPPKQIKEKPTKPESSKQIWTGEIDFTNPSKYRKLLKGYQRCDTCSYNIGQNNCKNFDSKASISIEFDQAELPSKVTLTIQPHNSISDIAIHGHIGSCNRRIPPLTPIKLTGIAKFYNEYYGFYIRFNKGEVENLRGNISSIIVRSKRSNPVDNDLLEAKIYYGSIDSGEIGDINLENAEKGSVFNSKNNRR